MTTLVWMHFFHSIIASANTLTGPSANFAWIITANAVGNSVTFPFVGRLSDIFGRRWLIISGSVVSLIGCALFARATSINECIGAGVLAGLGGSLHQICWSGLGEVIPRRSRGIAFGLLEASISPAQAFSPIIGKKRRVSTCNLIECSYSHFFSKYYGCKI